MKNRFLAFLLLILTGVLRLIPIQSFRVISCTQFYSTYMKKTAEISSNTVSQELFSKLLKIQHVN